MGVLDSFQLGGVQYHGEDGVTQACIDAVVRLVQSGAWIIKALLLTSRDRHCFYLKLRESEQIIIRPGFASGYPGEGPAGLAVVLHLLSRHHVDVEEIEVTEGFMLRAGESRLTKTDLASVDVASAVRPYRLWDYTYKVLEHRGGEREAVVKQYPLTVPFGIVDNRIWGLALSLESDPDAAIYKAYRRLEEGVSTRCGLKAHGRDVFRKAFYGPESKLTWLGIHEKEANGRAELFMGAFSARRNPRAHRQIADTPARSLREFLLVNELFLLESEAVQRRA